MAKAFTLFQFKLNWRNTKHNSN